MAHVTCLVHAAVLHVHWREVVRLSRARERLRHLLRRGTEDFDITRADRRVVLCQGGLGDLLGGELHKALGAGRLVAGEGARRVPSRVIATAAETG